MIGLGVGIDYSLFIVSRHRQNLAAGMDVETAAGRSLATSGSAVLFAGHDRVPRPVRPRPDRHPLRRRARVLGRAVRGRDRHRRADPAAGDARPAGPAHQRAGHPPPRRARARPGPWPPAGPARSPAIPCRLLRRQPGRPADPGRAAAQHRAGLHHPTPARPTDTTQRQAYDLMAQGFGAGRERPVAGGRLARRSPDQRPCCASRAAPRSPPPSRATPGVASATPPIPNPHRHAPPSSRSPRRPGRTDPATGDAGAHGCAPTRSRRRLRQRARAPACRRRGGRGHRRVHRPHRPHPVPPASRSSAAVVARARSCC